MEAILKASIARLKAAGLPEAEDILRILVKEVVVVSQEIAAVTPNSALKLLLPLVAMLEEPALRLIDKVDGKVG